MPLGAIIEKVNGSVESMSGNVSQNSVQPQVTKLLRTVANTKM